MELRLLAQKCPVMGRLSMQSTQRTLLRMARKCPYAQSCLSAIDTDAAKGEMMEKCPHMRGGHHRDDEGGKVVSSATTSTRTSTRISTSQGSESMLGRLGHRMLELRASGRYRYFAELERKVGKFPLAQFHGHDATKSLVCRETRWTRKSPEETRSVAVWCSNDYLGMGHHPTVLSAMRRALEEHGAGAGGTRNISGTSHLHVELERELADWHRTEHALVFSSGYVANETTLQTLPELLPGLHYISDALNHASMIQGMRKSKHVAARHIFRHNDTAHLEEILRSLPADAPKIVAFESVYSMDGDIAPVEEICDIARRYGALTFLDEVHAVGMYGPQGAGVAERDGIQSKVDIISGTLGKAVGVFGGYIAAPAVVVDAVRSFGSGFIFSTALPPSVAAGALASVRHLRASSVEREAQQAVAAVLKARLLERGLPVVPNPSHIVPVLVGNATLCKAAADILCEQFGVYVQPINYPTVPVGTERLRFTPGPLHTSQQLDHLVHSLSVVWDLLALPRTPDYVRQQKRTPKRPFAVHNSPDLQAWLSSVVTGTGGAVTHHQQQQQQQQQVQQQLL